MPSNISCRVFATKPSAKALDLHPLNLMVICEIMEFRHLTADELFAAPQNPVHPKPQSGTET